MRWGLTNMLMHKYRRFETQCTNYNTQSPMWSDYEILFIAINFDGMLQ